MVPRPSSELLRARYRVLFFAGFSLSCFASGGRASLAVAAAALVLAVLSWRVALAQGSSLAVTFVTLDWLALGLALGLGNGTRSWLMVSIPLLVITELLPCRRQDRLALLAPAATTLAVLLIVDPTLGGSRFVGLLEVAGLVAAGALPVMLLGRPRSGRNGRKRAPAVDPTTGFSTLSRVADLLGNMLREAADEHAPLSVICVRLHGFGQTTEFLGHARAEQVVGAVARKLRHRLRPGDLAFRVSADTFLFALRERLPGEARSEAAGMRHDVASGLVEHQRQTISTGVASYPAARGLESLLREAQRDLLESDAELQPVATRQHGGAMVASRQRGEAMVASL
jgi:diguanylate cyclase (GGDEF)-like protein